MSAADDPLATDLTRVYECAERLRATGNIEVTATDFKELTESDNGNSLSLRRLGNGTEFAGRPGSACDARWSSGQGV